MILSNNTFVSECGIRLTSLGYPCLGGPRPATPEQVEQFVPVTMADFAVAGFARGFLWTWEVLNSLSTLPLYGLLHRQNRGYLNIWRPGEWPRVPLFSANSRASTFLPENQDYSVQPCLLLDIIDYVPVGTGIVVNPMTRFAVPIAPDECERLRATACKGVLAVSQEFVVIPSDQQTIEAIKDAVHPAFGRR